MASNFRISAHRNSENLHLKLMGDFDGSSACQLLNVLKKRANGAHKIIIHTSCLNNIHPFGKATFHQNLCDIKDLYTRLMFTGENAKQLAPEMDLCL
jgi:hypothetical protein